MLCIGNKYIFNDLDKNQLKKFGINEIKYILNFDKKLIQKHNWIILNEIQLTDEEKKFLENLKNKKIFNIENFLEEFLHKLYIPSPENFEEKFEIKNLKPLNKFQYIQKRIIDFFVGGCLLILTFPIILYSMYRIKKESPDGPILFTQKRIGKDGKEFTCYKFRSMRTNIDYFNHYTQENDPRIFPWGAFMRQTRIDELPQLINVFKGEMHLIGPRAEWSELVKNYEKVWPYYHQRHIIAPGITGWAQVNYPYGKNLEDTRQKLMYDLYYIKNWSLKLEIKTIIKTIQVMIGRKGL
ncbi:sugar transferase [Caminibacter mediatlanticus]|uniref:Sugar transferase n=1 Tax=Caminibacter mediatlanticus TB-2 TaxID=391592 RepID=A0AAI9AGC5_9BACT|nr:sugar transferase [Caminibacter mediatlanticus]EDM22989.1 sugar transferase [Caminibacter mediatlanticus TB-2]